MLISKVQSINPYGVKNLKKAETNSNYKSKNDNQVSFGMKCPKGIKALMTALVLFASSCGEKVSKNVSQKMSGNEFLHFSFNVRNDIGGNYGIYGNWLDDDTIRKAAQVIKDTTYNMGDSIDPKGVIKVFRKKAKGFKKNSLKEKAYNFAAGALEKGLKSKETLQN